MKVIDWIAPCEQSPSPTPRDGRPADYMIYLECSDLSREEKTRLGNEACEAVKREVREKGYRFSGMQHIELGMIDTIGLGIRRIFGIQRDNGLPVLSYGIEKEPRSVTVTIPGLPEGSNWLLPEEKVTTPEAAYDVFKGVLTPGDDKENLFVLLLDTKSRPLCEPLRISRGTHDSAPAFARDVFKEALKWGAHAVMVAHNHPTGDPTPSESDLAFTRQLIDLGQLAGIPVRDHLILGAADLPDGFISIRATTDVDFTERMQ